MGRTHLDAKLRVRRKITLSAWLKVGGTDNLSWSKSDKVPLVGQDIFRCIVTTSLRTSFDRVVDFR